MLKPSLIHPVRTRAIRVQSRIGGVTSEQKPDSDVARFPIGNRRNVVVSWFKGKLYVHIREYSYEDFPTNKGICLTPSRWATLVKRVDILEDDFKKSWEDEPGMSIQDEGEHLGGNVYAKASSEYKTMDIRNYWIPEGVIRLMPTRKGIRLRNFEWRSLVSKIPDINNCCEELRNAVPCSQNLDHSLIQGFLACSECNPQGDKM